MNCERPVDEAWYPDPTKDQENASMGHREITIGSILDAARWAKDAYRVAKDNPPGSPARLAKLDQLAFATACARQKADLGQNKVVGTVLRVAELGLQYVRTPNRTRGRHVRKTPVDRQGTGR